MTSKTNSINALRSGFVVLPGGCDKYGNILLVFPSKTHVSLIPSSQLMQQMRVAITTLIKRVPRSKLKSKFAFLADFTHTSPLNIEFLIDLVVEVERDQPGTVNIFYMLLPSNLKLQKMIKARIGYPVPKRGGFLSMLKTSKNNPSHYSVIAYKCELLDSTASLRQHINPNELPVEFGGSLSYKHEQLMALEEALSAFYSKVQTVLNKLPETQNRLESLREGIFSIDGDEDTANADEVISWLNENYLRLTEDIQLHETIEGFEHWIHVCQQPQRHPQYDTLLKHMNVEEHLARLERIQQELLQCRQALQEILVDLEKTTRLRHQLRDYKRRSGETMQWIQTIGIPHLTTPPEYGENVDEMRRFRQMFYEEIFHPGSKNAELAWDQLRKLNNALLANAGESEMLYILDYATDLETKLKGFEEKLEKRKACMDEGLKGMQMIMELTKWYERTIQSMPFDMLKYENNYSSTQIFTLPSNWMKWSRSYLEKHPSPQASHLECVKNCLPHLNGQVKRSETRLLLHRLSLLEKLLVKQQITVQELREILEWRGRNPRPTASKETVKQIKVASKVTNLTSSKKAGTTKSSTTLAATEKSIQVGNNRRQSTPVLCDKSEQTQSSASINVVKRDASSQTASPPLSRKPSLSLSTVSSNKTEVFLHPLNWTVEKKSSPSVDHKLLDEKFERELAHQVMIREMEFKRRTQLLLEAREHLEKSDILEDDISFIQASLSQRWSSKKSRDDLKSSKDEELYTDAEYQSRLRHVVDHLSHEFGDGDGSLQGSTRNNSQADTLLTDAEDMSHLLSIDSNLMNMKEMSQSHKVVHSTSKKGMSGLPDLVDIYESASINETALFNDLSYRPYSSQSYGNFLDSMLY